MKKHILVTTTVTGGSGVKYSHSEVKEVDTRKSRPAFAMHGSRHAGGLPILRRTEKFYANLEWSMRRGGASHV